MINSFNKGLILGGIVGVSMGSIMSGKKRCKIGRKMLKVGRTMFRRTEDIMENVMDIMG